MKKKFIKYKSTNRFSKLINDYIKKDENLASFYNLYPELNNFQFQFENKRNHKINRQLLVDVLFNQNDNIKLSELSKKNIDSLKNTNTFTVTTGHQLCLFSGPLYCIYKIVSTINLVKQLKIKYPDKNFVPIFWMASEDHDFEEINHINLFREKISWNTIQKGPVGRIKLDSIDKIIDKIESLTLNSKNSEPLIKIFKNSYLKNNNLSSATRSLINQLFGEYGIVILDGDDKSLKKTFLPVIKKDLISNDYYKLILKSTEELSKKYKTQAQVKKTNFFLISDGKREKINTVYSDDTISKITEKFSPNVLMRPLYQESILPNIAYVGGGAEISYWLQLKKVFDHEGIPFPILLLRNSVLLLDKKQDEKIKKMGFDIKEFFDTENNLLLHYTNKSIKKDFNLNEEKEKAILVFNSILNKYKDQNLISFISAEQKKLINSLNKIEKKIIKSKKINHADNLKSISLLKNKLFPQNKLQERHENFIPYYLKHGDNFIKILINELDPLNTNFVILTL